MPNGKLEALVREFLSAYAAKDIEAIKNMVIGDVILRDWNLEVTGRDSAIHEFQTNFRQSESIEIQVNTMYLSQSGVAAEIEILVNGKEKLRVVDVFKFDEDQKIASIVSYKGF